MRFLGRNVTTVYLLVVILLLSNSLEFTLMVLMSKFLKGGVLVSFVSCGLLSFTAL